MLQGTEAEEAKIFTDAAFWKSMTFKLSSSNVSPGTYHWGGFGPVVKDGYGVNYAIAKDSLKFSISSWKSASATNSFKFRDVLERSLKDMMLLFPPRCVSFHGLVFIRFRSLRLFHKIRSMGTSMASQARA